MELKLLSVALLLTVLLASTQAVIPPEQYWKSVLPSTQMPNAIKDILYRTYTSASEEPVEGWIGPKGLFSYRYYETELHGNQNADLFILEKDLKRGKTATLYYMKSSNMAPFLPREVADMKPFSSNRLPEIYSMYSVQPNSVEAEAMKDTINECEAPGIEGEEKYCATSLESMVDFTKSRLGKDVKAISTEVSKQNLKQKYAITEEARRVKVAKMVVCHKGNYPYAVFYCHKMKDTRFYMVSMEGSDGTRMKAVVACHTDTSKWNPKHLAFQVLEVRPGTVPVCHFLPEDHIVWFTN